MYLPSRIYLRGVYRVITNLCLQFAWRNSDMEWRTSKYESEVAV
jgi:hypothetical protein